jgi:hypothetical protein
MGEKVGPWGRRSGHGGETLAIEGGARSGHEGVGRAMGEQVCVCNIHVVQYVCDNTAILNLPSGRTPPFCIVIHDGTSLSRRR